MLKSGNENNEPSEVLSVSNILWGEDMCLRIFTNVSVNKSDAFWFRKNIFSVQLLKDVTWLNSGIAYKMFAAS